MKRKELEYEIARMKVEYLHFMLEIIKASLAGDISALQNIKVCLEQFLLESKEELDNL